MTKLGKRSAKFGVGKEIGGAVYVHRAYEHVLPASVARAKRYLPSDFTYTVVKYDLSTQNTSFISSPDFDAADEPIVGDSFLASADGKVKRRKQLRDPYIYHHKWLFVADDYSGFDVAASNQRSLAWMALEGIDKTRIGRKSYWEKHVIPMLNNADACWYRSQVACKKLRVTSCELSHLRNAGKLPFRKVGNAFLYRIDGDESA